MQAADLKSICLLYSSNMSLARVVEIYMTLEREEKILCSEFLSTTRNVSSLLRRHTNILSMLSAHLGLLCDEQNPGLARTYLARIQYNIAQLAALDKAVAENVKKTLETRAKCTYTARPQIVLLSESTSRVLMSSVAEIARMKREVQVLLQQM